MLRRIRLAGALAAFVAVTPIALLQAQEEAQHEKHMRTMSRASDMFMPHVLEMNAAEVEFGRLAQEKSSNPDIRDYGAMLVRDHYQALETLGGLWRIGMDSSMTTMDTDVSRTKPDAYMGYPNLVKELSQEHQNTYERLSRLSGESFDNEFLKVAISTHQEGIKFLEAHSKVPASSASPQDDRVNAAFATLSRDLLPLLRRHLEAAQNIQQKLQK
jgi:putative membrane protein